MDLPVLIFDGHWQSGSMVMKSEHRAHYRMLSPKSVYDCLMRDIYTSGLLEDSGTAHPVLPCTMEQVSVLPMGWKKNRQKRFHFLFLEGFLVIAPLVHLLHLCKAAETD